MLLADVEMLLPPGVQLTSGSLRLNLTRGGFVGMANLNNNLCRLFGAVPPGFAGRDPAHDVSHEAYGSVDIRELQRWFDSYFFVTAALKHVEWTALYRIHSRIAERFRLRNVFLVGDAAHIHSRVGGQGMNLGIGDAFNLGWKMALVAKGRAHETLLDSYESERYGAARMVLRYADRGFALEATTGRIATWARDHLATRLVGPLMRSDWMRDLVFKLFSQTWITYRRSSVVDRDEQLKSGPAPGDRAPYGTFEHMPNGTVQGIFDLIAGTKHSFLLFEGPIPDSGLNSQRCMVEELAAEYGLMSRVHVIRSAERALHRLYGASRHSVLVLIRPHGHVEYVGHGRNLSGPASHMARLYIRSRGDSRT